MELENVGDPILLVNWAMGQPRRHYSHQQFHPFPTFLKLPQDKPIPVSYMEVETYRVGAQILQAR
jgi:hypothetical protein